MDMSWISFHIQKGNPFISKMISFISMNDILEISSIRDISGYLKILQDISRYLFGANSQMELRRVLKQDIIGTVNKVLVNYSWRLSLTTIDRLLISDY